jgi:hypothetical protein
MHPLKPLDNTLIHSSANFIKEHKYKIIAAIAAIALVVLAFTPPGAILAAAISTGIMGALIVKGGAIAIGAAIIGISFLFSAKQTEANNKNHEDPKVAELAKSRKKARDVIEEAQNLTAQTEKKDLERRAARNQRRFEIKNPPQIAVVESPARPIAPSRRVESIPTRATIARTPEERKKAYEEFRAQLIANQKKDQTPRYNPEYTETVVEQLPSLYASILKQNKL